MLFATVVEGTKGSLLRCSGLMLNLGRRITSGRVGAGVERGTSLGGKFSGWRSLLIETLGASGSEVCLSERKVLGW